MISDNQNKRVQDQYLVRGELEDNLTPFSTPLTALGFVEV
jgi:hypothetical protein